ncbi:MAG TPA: hypothetical protein PKY22_00435 [Accumulibacter sp.]|nr:hypothetical protein [Accumulibacter sp.]
MRLGKCLSNRLSGLNKVAARRAPAGKADARVIKQYPGDSLGSACPAGHPRPLPMRIAAGLLQCTHMDGGRPPAGRRCDC